MKLYGKCAAVTFVLGAGIFTGCGSGGQSTADSQVQATPKVVVVVATPTPSSNGGVTTVPTESPDSTAPSAVEKRMRPYVNAYTKAMNTVLDAEKTFKTGTSKADLSEAKATIDQAQTDFMLVIAPPEFTKADSLLREGIRLDSTAFSLAELAIETHTSSQDAEDDYAQAGEVMHRANAEFKRVLDDLGIK